MSTRWQTVASALGVHRVGFFMEPTPSWQCLSCPNLALKSQEDAAHHHADEVVKALAGMALVVVPANVPLDLHAVLGREAELKDRVADLEEDVRQAQEAQSFVEREMAAMRETPATAFQAAPVASTPDKVEERIRRELIEVLHDKSQEVSAENPTLSRGLRQAEMLIKKGLF